MDITNPMTADYMSLTIGHDTSAAEAIARAVPGADIVKVSIRCLCGCAGGPAFENDQRGSVFFASDSAQSKATVKTPIESLGFNAVDAGGLTARVIWNRSPV